MVVYVKKIIFSNINIHMYTFKKASDFVEIDNDTVKYHVSIEVKQVNDTFLIFIPSLQIRSYTVQRSDIDRRIDEVVESFFRYWLKTKGEQEFIDLMLLRGFSLSGHHSSVEKVKNRQQLIKMMVDLGYTISNSQEPLNMVAESKPAYITNRTRDLQFTLS